MDDLELSGVVGGKRKRTTHPAEVIQRPADLVGTPRPALLTASRSPSPPLRRIPDYPARWTYTSMGSTRESVAVVPRDLSTVCARRTISSAPNQAAANAAQMTNLGSAARTPLGASGGAAHGLGAGVVDIG
jgi:hypothetical protein